MLNIHDILINLASKIEDTEVAVMTSAGIDSASIVFALLELKKKVHIYSFTLDTHKSTDFTNAQKLAQLYNLEFTPIILPTNINILINDVLKLHNEFGCIKKTEYECVWPFLYAYSQVRENTIANGIPADGHFCLSKKGMIHYKDRIDEFRELYFGGPNVGQQKQHNLLAKKYNKKLFMPYLSKDIYNYLYGTTWEECNKPNQKQPILNAFPKDFKNIQILKHTNLQLGDSGISELFKTLLDTSLNTKNYKSVVGIFNEINRGGLTNE